MSDSTDTIVLIHGLWMTPRSWENWAARYESRGYTVLAPAWPGLEAEVEALNRDPSPLAKLDITQIVDNYERIIRELETPPIIMGHSLGGTVTQLLLDRGLGAAGVGVASGTVKGVRDLPLSTLRVSRPVLGNPFNRGKAIPLSAKQIPLRVREHAQPRGLRRDLPALSRAGGEHRPLRGRLRRPEPQPVTVDFRNERRAPLLFIAFENDHVVPPKASRHNAEKYARSTAITSFKEFSGRPHFPGAPGWEEVADHALSWATANAMSNGPLSALRGGLAVAS